MIFADLLTFFACSTVLTTAAELPEVGIKPQAPAQAGDSIVMAKCKSSAEDPLGLQEWGACTGTTCYVKGSFDSSERTAIRNAATGLCLDAAGGFPGWAARVMPCETTYEPAYWGNNPITSATWQLLADGTLRTNISRAGSPNASGEACLFSSVPVADGNDWWTAGKVGMWWCDGSPESKWKFAKADSNQADRLYALSGPKAGFCVAATPTVPVPSPAPPPDPAPSPISCPKGCLSSPCNGLPFCNKKLSAQARAEDLVSHLSLQEKANSLTLLVPYASPLGAPPILVGEAQHGLLKPCVGPDGKECNSPDTTECRCATSFPSLVGIGASFNQSLFAAMGDVMGDEAQAFFNVLDGNTNMLFWAPSINMARNPLWGRNAETPGEDPTVNSLYGEAFILGLQGGALASNWSDPNAPPLKAVANLKHFLAYDVECTSGGKNSGNGGQMIQNLFSCAAPGVDRFHFEGFISDADLNDYYLAVFKRPIANARPASIMCSFPSVNGVPSCANGLMQNSLARDTWGFDGFIVSDCGGVDFLNQAHYMTSTPLESVAVSIKNGLDAELGIPGPWGPGEYFGRHMNKTVESKLLQETELDRSAIRMWRTIFRMGMFEPRMESKWAHLGFEAIDSARNQQTALEAAVQSMVLLQNKNGLLPIRLPSFSRIAVIGPFQNLTGEMQGGYSGKSIRIQSHSPGQILADRIKDHNSVKKSSAAHAQAVSLTWHEGVKNGVNDSSHVLEAVNVAKDADLVLLFVGDTHVSEFRDRTDNGLEAAQELLLESICATNVPTVVVAIAGHSLELSHAKEHCDAILFAFLPSQFGGDAIIDTLLGVYSPAGRLPVTFYTKDILKERDPVDMSLRGGSGITYQHYRGSPIWEFGFGLSYTTFEFIWSRKLQLVADQWHDRVTATAVTRGEVLLSYTVLVTNTGSRASSVAVLGFVSTSNSAAASSNGQPSPAIRKLFNFTRVWLDIGESTNVTLSLEPSVLASSDHAGLQAVRPGLYTIAIGGVGRAGRTEDGAASATLLVEGYPSSLFSMHALREHHNNSLRYEGLYGAEHFQTYV